MMDHAPTKIICQAMKEILLAGDTNRLVAELTFVPSHRAAVLRRNRWYSGSLEDEF